MNRRAPWSYFYHSMFLFLSTFLPNMATIFLTNLQTSVHTCTHIHTCIQADTHTHTHTYIHQPPQMYNTLYTRPSKKPDTPHLKFTQANHTAVMTNQKLSQQWRGSTSAPHYLLHCHPNPRPSGDQLIKEKWIFRQGDEDLDTVQARLPNTATHQTY